jgi:hypothetical protein
MGTTLLDGSWLNICISSVVATMIVIQTSRFVSITCDEIMTMESVLWIFIHAYVIQN